MHLENEWKDLGKMIEQDRMMKDFMKTKDREKTQLVSTDSMLAEEQVFVF